MYKHIANILMLIILILLIFVLIYGQAETNKHEHIHQHDGIYLHIDDNIKLFGVVDKYNELLKYTIYLEKRLNTLEDNLDINKVPNSIISPPKKID
jgi:hypothetical protein|tara:strand:- start:467 stop:754 length:288 start_codon:yes stop_codon:yes gene_type:complete